MTPRRPAVTSGRYICHNRSGAQAHLRDLEEGARAMRKTLSARWQAVFLLGGHLAEGTVETIGQEHGIVAETRAAARRPDQRAIDAPLKRLDLAVRPGDAQGG